MKILAILVAGLLALAAAVFVVGAVLPERHLAAVEARYASLPEAVYGAVYDVVSGPEWRTGLVSVEVLSSPDQPLRWREAAEWGTLTFEREGAEPNRRITHGIVEEGQGFGGTWTWEIEPRNGGTLLRITETGSVSNPLYRFMSRFVFGHYTRLETYARDLGRRLGEAVEPHRVAEPRS